MKLFNTGTSIWGADDASEDLTIESMARSFRDMLQPPSKWFASHNCDELFARIPITESAVPNFLGLGVAVDPLLPPNTIRVEHSDGRREMFTLAPDGKLYRIALSELEDELDRMRRDAFKRIGSF